MDLVQLANTTFLLGKDKVQAMILIDCIVLFTSVELEPV